MQKLTINKIITKRGRRRITIFAKRIHAEYKFNIFLYKIPLKVVWISGRIFIFILFSLEKNSNSISHFENKLLKSIVFCYNKSQFGRIIYTWDWILNRTQRNFSKVKRRQEQDDMTSANSSFVTLLLTASIYTKI